MSSPAPAPAPATTKVSFTEEMKGYATIGETDFDKGFRQGKTSDSFLMFHLTITADNVSRFVTDPKHEATAVGWLRWPSMGEDMPVEKGVFNLFVDEAGPLLKRMIYRLFVTHKKEGPLTLMGYKVIQDNRTNDVWADTTTLFTTIFRGHVSESEEAKAEILARGILHIYLRDFMKQLTTIKVEGPSFAEREKARKEFGGFFLGSLWEVYGIREASGQRPAIFVKRYTGGMDPGIREIPLYTLDGVPNAAHATHSFTTEDMLGLSFERFTRGPCDDVVMIIHGLTTSTDMFIMPEHYNLVTYLLDHGYEDVWCLDYRMSNRHSYNLHPHRYTLDDIALFDHPAALAHMREYIGDRRIHVICHCLGAASFTMSLFAKAVTGIRSCIANSVALTPRVPRWSQMKLSAAPFMVEYVLGFPYLNPLWSQEPGFNMGKIFSKAVSMFHGECNVQACHMLSMMWGTGWPALYSHENLADVTHRRGGDLYGGTSMHYYRHVLKMIRAGGAVKYNPDDPRLARLPNNYFEYAKDVETPVLFMTGESNRVFTDSNVVCYQRLEKLAPGRHELHVFKNYGHQDPFMGKNVAQDIFPRLVHFLDKHSGKAAAS